MNLGDRLKQLRKYRGITQKELAKAVGISQAALASIEMGRGTKHLQALSDLLGTQPQWLQFGSGRSPMADESIAPPGYIPILDWQDVILWVIPGSENKVVTKGFVASPTPDDPEKMFYALKIKNDSMINEARKFPQGNLLIVDPILNLQNLKSGDFIIAVMPGEKEAVFRQLIIDGGRKYMKPFNPYYKQEEINSEFLLLGKVIEVRIHDLKET